MLLWTDVHGEGWGASSAVLYSSVLQSVRISLLTSSINTVLSGLLTSPLIDGEEERRRKEREGGEGRVVMMLIRESYARYFRHTTAQHVI